jgi:uncharacterized protein (DUF3084 family)
MARTKTISSVEAQIRKTEQELLRTKARYDGLAETLKALQAERKELQGRMVMESFDRSGKTMDELMIFLGSGRK